MNKSTTLFLLFTIIFSFNSSAQSNFFSTHASAVQDAFVLASYDVDLDGFRQATKEAKHIKTSASTPVRLSLPTADGMQTFRLYSSQVMHPDLQAKFPMIKTFIGVSEADPSMVARISLSHKDVHLLISKPGMDDLYLDPHDGVHRLYYAKEYKAANPVPRETFSCGVESDEGETLSWENELPQDMKSFTTDCMLRVYRIAIATTGEYAQYHGGTTEDALAAIVTSLVRINGIYERDFGVSLELIANNDDIIYLNGGSDPYTSGSPGTLLGENQTNIDNVIGFQNYDIGHVYDVAGGGLATLRCPCGNAKARAMTGLGNPINDPFYVDYVSHEIGHQFGGNHTQNNNCNRNNNTSWEPGSASTIMGYAGICNPNVQNNSDDHFHGGNIQEVENFIRFGNGNSCGTLEDIGNEAIELSLENNAYFLPVATPFVLEAIASDPNEEDILTYCWEQMDNAVATMPPVETNTVGPAFRSNSPTTDPARYFPNIDAIVNGVTPTWEVLPFFSRDMSFRVTVRDNHPVAGCTAWDEVLLTFDESAGPFVVEVPNTPLSWDSGSTQMVEWDVAGTDQAPVSANAVDIYLSLDGGYTYPIVLLEDTPNDGSEAITVPAVSSDQCRVMVKGHRSVFFDISDRDFTIISPFSFVVDDPNRAICAGEETSFAFDVQVLDQSGGPVDFDVDNLPIGANASFDPTFVTDNGTVVLTLSNVVPGFHEITVKASNDTFTAEIPVFVQVDEGTLGEVAIVYPQDLETMVSIQPTITWEPVDNALSYTLQFDSSPAFNSDELIEIITPDTEYQTSLLDAATVYYWRVFATSACVNAGALTSSSFQTVNVSCTTYESTDTPVQISGGGADNYFSSILINDTYAISRLEVRFNMTHSWVGDMNVSLTNSVTGAAIDLVDRMGTDGGGYGCDANDLDLHFADDAANTAEDLETSCSNDTYAAQGSFQPITPLASQIGENIGQQVWTLEFRDNVSGDGGALNEWSLFACSDSPITQTLNLDNEGLTVNLGETKLIPPSLLGTDDMDPTMARYVLRTVPSFGDLSLEIGGVETVLAAGDAFTQFDIDNAYLSYIQDGNDADQDLFTFDLLGSEGAWIPNNTFNITILTEGLTLSAEINSDILCVGDANGEILLSASGGLAPYQYRIGMEALTDDPLFIGLEAGEYTFMVRDDAGNTSSRTIEITDPAAISIMLSNDNYDIIVDASGGTGMLSYSLDGENFQDDNTFPGVGNGSFTVYVRDENDCIQSADISIDIDVLDGNFIKEDVACFGESTGSVTLSGAGGIPPYEYALGTSDYQSSPTFDGLAAGFFQGYVRDANGDIFVIETIEIDQPDELVVSDEVMGYDIRILAEGGTPPYSYSLDGMNFQEEDLFMSNEPGTYTLYVQDANGCISQSSTSVNVSTLSITAQATAVSCAGDNDGQIMVNYEGGVDPVSFSLDNMTFQDNPVFSGLIAGDYTVYARDAFQTASFMLVVESPDPIVINDASPFGLAITVDASGGTGELEYSVNGTSYQSSNMLNVGSNDTYTVYVRDENACVATIDVTVSNLHGMEFDRPEIFCAGEYTNAYLTIIDVNGGFPPFQYSLDDVNYQDDPALKIDMAGDYNVYIIDDIGQKYDSGTITIEEPDPLTIDYMLDWNDLTIIGGGGTPPYTYSVDGIQYTDDPFFNGLPFDELEIFVQDDYNCVTSTIIIISSTEVALDAETTISPNPGNGSYTVNILCESCSNLGFHIYDVEGSLVRERTGLAPNGNYQIDIQDAPSGIYILQLYEIESGHQQVFKLIKE